MIQRIKDWLFTKQLVEKEMTVKISTPTLQEDPAVHETKKRVRKAFEQQKQQMVARRNRPHSLKCEDPDICTKRNCFKVVPDKIVDEVKDVIIQIQDIRKNIQE